MSELPRWPLELPQQLITVGFNKTLGDARLRQNMDVGSKVRRRNSNAPELVSGMLQVSTAGIARYERFWYDAVADGGTDEGTALFVIPDQLRHDRIQTTSNGLPVLFEDGTVVLTVAWWIVCFADDAPSVPEAQGHDLYHMSVNLFRYRLSQ